MKKVSPNLVVVLLAITGFWCYSMLTPARAEAPTNSILEALQGIQEAIVSLSAPREGYWEYFETPADSNQVLVTVPAGKQFVLRELYCPRSIWPDWQLNVDDEVYFTSEQLFVSVQTGVSSTFNYVHNFPDECVAFGPGITLTFINDSASVLDMTVVGYFRDSQ